MIHGNRAATGIGLWLLLLAVSAWAQDVLIQVDPSDRLAGGFILAEWSTPGNLDGWSGSGLLNLGCSGGSIAGTSNVVSPYIQKTNMATGPDLDFGFFDFLQIRLRVPSGFQDNIRFQFGTTVNAGFASTRSFQIPADRLVQDGNWHTYRMDLGLVVWWRDTLRDIQIYPLGNSGNGRSFEIDYVETGDLPGDTLLINNKVGFYTGQTQADCSYQESKHAVFWWSPQSFIENPGFNPSVMGRRALRMVEESYQVYCRKLGYAEPFESWDAWRRDGKRYKVNQTTWWGGFWMGGNEGFGYFNVPGYGLADEGWGNPTPHEFGHVVQGHQPGFLNGGHWESHANFLRQAWQLHFAERFPDDQQSQLDMQVLELSNLRQDHGRLIYRDFRIHQALQDYAGDLGLDPTTVGQLWRVGEKDNTVYAKLVQTLPANVSLADTVAYGLRYWPLLQFSDGDKFKAQLWSTADNKAWHDYLTGSLLIPCQDRPGWWRVPLERAPERFAYMYHELDRTGPVVTVELRGYDLAGRTEDWRWSLAAIDTNGSTRFSPLWAPGTQSLALNPTENRVLVIVVATPTDNSLNLEYADNRILSDRHPDRLRYGYEVRIDGATPARRQLKWNSVSGSYHPNGGGWVATGASADTTAFVGPNARVLGTAKVRNAARIENYAVVTGNATVRDSAVVSGYSVVKDNAVVQDQARIRDRAVIQDSCVVANHAVVRGYAHLYGSARIQDYAIARGVSMPWDSTISGTAILDYDYSMAESVSDGVHFSHIPWGGWYRDYYVLSKVKPRGLVASYRIEEPEGEIVWDAFGVQHAIVRGSPLRITDPERNSKVLRLDGNSQYILLDRSVCDLSSGTFSLWCKPSGSFGKPIWFMGAFVSRFLKLELDASGYPVFTITDGTTTRQLISNRAVTDGNWIHLAVTLDGVQGNLFVDGISAASAPVTLVPENVLGANNYAVLEGMYIGRDYEGNLFRGDVEDIRVYNVALTPEEVAGEIRRSGSCIGTMYFNNPKAFDGVSTAAESGVHNGLERVLEAMILPDTSDDVTYYEAVLDSTDERDGRFEGTGFGLDNGEILVRLENVGFWRTGVKATLGQWQKITVGFNGHWAGLYVNGQLKASKTYSATESDVTGKNFRVGYAMDTGGNKYYFDGQIRDLYIHDRLNLGDSEPPHPAPAAFVQVPTVVSKTQVTMTAATGTDSNGPVEYRFDELTGHPGGTGSGWQTSPTYIDQDLQPGTEYAYRVTMRDLFGNETTPSNPKSIWTPFAGDFDRNGRVDLLDFSILAQNWQVRYERVNPGRVAHWTFNEASGTTANDTIAGRSGKIYGGAALTGSGALSFDGSNDYVSLPIGPLLNTLTSSSFATWVNFSNSGGAWQRIFDFGTGTSVNFFLTPRTGTAGPLRCAITTAGGGGEQQVTAPATLPSGWHHVTVTIDAARTTMTLYLDGVAVDVNADTLLIPSSLGNTGNNWLGKSQYGADAYFSGSIDDFEIYNYALKPEEVQDLYHRVPIGTTRDMDLDANGVIDLEDLRIWIRDWTGGTSK